MRSSLGIILLCFASAIVGCGASVVDTDPAGGAGGSPSGAGGGGNEGCPTLEPNAGDPCTTPGLVCALSATCCSPTATCSNGMWTVTAPACAEACAPCGTTSCGGNGICVNVEGALSEPLKYYCAPNPCDGQAPSCACGATLCPSACEGVYGSILVCS